MNTNEYLSDSELLALMELTEEQGLLAAPRDLAENVRCACARQPGKAQQSRKKQFNQYCLRVGMATAACLVLLFGSARLGENVQSSAPNITFSQHFNQLTDQIEAGYLDITQQISQFNFNFGGNDHE